MKKFLLVLIAVAVAILAVSCTVPITTADPVVTGLAVDGITKTEYLLGDALDLTGATLTARYDNGTVNRLVLEKAVEDKIVTLSDYDMNKSGEQKVTVTFGGKTTTFTIRIEQWTLLSVELFTEPYVLDYVVGEDVDFAGASIRLTYEGNKVVYRDVSPEMVQAYRNSVVGTEKIRLSLNGVDMSFDVRFHEKTAIAVSTVYIDEGNNFVFIGQGDRYDTTGMTVSVTYDNGEKPKFDAKKDLSDSLFIQLNDQLPETVTAVMMYYPDDYRETYTYTLYGTTRVAIGEKVYPGKELATNSVTRGDQTYALNPVTSKSYGTVTNISINQNGSKDITVSTTERYSLDSVSVKKGDIIAKDTFIGYVNGAAIYSNGGGIVDETTVDGVVLKTAPTTTFTSRVKEKSFSRMEILTLPKPTRFKDTTINNMIEGDELDASTGNVRVYYDDGSQQMFRMDDGMIAFVNETSESVNVPFVLKPGRQKVLVVYGQVVTNYAEFYVTMEGKYPVELTVDLDSISGRTFYFGDKISLSSMTYHVRYNNGTSSEPEPITEDMVGEGSLECAEKDRTYDATIMFSLPSKYLSLLPTDENGLPIEYIHSYCRYVVAPQPIKAIEFAKKPVKVYVTDKSNIQYEGALLDVYYRNNDRKTVDLSDGELNVITEEVTEWDEIETFNFTYSGATFERLYVFMRQGDSETGTAAEIIRGKYKGLEARVVYFDRFNEKSGTQANYTYYLINGFAVESVKVNILKDVEGKEIYKKDYTQYEDWDFSGLELNVTYAGGASAVVDLTGDMVYGGNTYKKGTDIPVKFYYLGATDDNTLKINVGDRVPTSLTPVSKGRSVYTARFNAKIDFSDYVFTLSYNAGPSERITGDMLKDIPGKETSSGFWYRMYSMIGVSVDSLSVPGTVIYELCYSYPDENAPKGYSYIRSMPYSAVAEGLAEHPDSADFTVFTVTAVEGTNPVVRIAYEQNVRSGDKTINQTYRYTETIIEDECNVEIERHKLNSETSVDAVLEVTEGTEKITYPVLAEVAAGWEIMLSEFFDGEVIEKYLTVYMLDADTGETIVDYVRITPDMLNYNKTEETLGYRPVTITYKNNQCKVYVYVWRAELAQVDVAKEPLKNYIYTQIDSEADLDLEGGVIELTFQKYSRNGERAGEMKKYVRMDSDDLTYSGFIRNLYSKEGEKVTIGIQYKTYDNLMTSYEIFVYDRQDVSFSYSNIIFFYGNAAPAAYSARKLIDEFELPTDITLTYIEAKDLITLSQYLALGSAARKYYMPVTMYDENMNMTMSMFIRARGEMGGSGDIVTSNYIDPAAGSYYVKYGRIALVSEEDYDRLDEATRAYLIPVPTYKANGELVETFYTTTNEAIVGPKIRWYEGVIVDQLTKEEYNALSEEEKAQYEEISNSYYILMCVVDDRSLKPVKGENKFNIRYYETANYAFQRYTVIPKVVEVSVENGDEKAKVLRVNTSFIENNQRVNGNPYAIYYLHNPGYAVLTGIQAAIETEYNEVNYINSVYLASPNEKYFEIIIKFMDNYEESGATDWIVREIYYRVLSALTSEDFYDLMGVRLTSINFDLENGGAAYDFNANVNQKDIMKTRIAEMTITGVNIFDKTSLQEDIDNGTHYNKVSYTLSFGDTKTRRGVLQLLDGYLGVRENEGVYSLFAGQGTLEHPSYTVDLGNIVLVAVDENTVKVSK